MDFPASSIHLGVSEFEEMLFNKKTPRGKRGHWGPVDTYQLLLDNYSPQETVYLTHVDELYSKPSAGSFRLDGLPAEIRANIILFVEDFPTLCSLFIADPVSKEIFLCWKKLSRGWVVADCRARLFRLLACPESCYSENYASAIREIPIIREILGDYLGNNGRSGWTEIILGFTDRPEYDSPGYEHDRFMPRLRFASGFEFYDLEAFMKLARKLMLSPSLPRCLSYSSFVAASKILTRLEEVKIESPCLSTEEQMFCLFESGPGLGAPANWARFRIVEWRRAKFPWSSLRKWN